MGKVPSLFKDAVITAAQRPNVQKLSDFLRTLVFPAFHLADGFKVVQTEVEILQNFVHFFFRIVTDCCAATKNPRQSCKQSTLKLTHCGPVTQICVFTLQLCKTDDANLRF